MTYQNALGKPDSIWKSPYTQQGDVILKKCGDYSEYFDGHLSIPEYAEKVDGNLVLKGQTNSHALFGGKFQLFLKGEILFVKVDEPTILDHVKDLQSNTKAEHHAQWIPVGEYFVDNVMEYDHVREESGALID